MDQYRPIDLGNFMFKLITKIIARRLRDIWSHILSPKKFWFIPNRNIRNCMTSASKWFNAT